MNKYLKIFLALAIVAYPTSIQADSVLTASSSTSSSTAVVASVTIPAVKAVAAPAITTAKAISTATTAVATNTQSVYITAYASVPDETSDHPFITASGETVADGIVADNLLPFGTQIQIPSLFGDKIFTIEDRTSQRFSGRVDIWMPAVSQAVDFGIHKATIVILNSIAAVK